MKRVCGWAPKRVLGVDESTVGELPGHLRERWPAANSSQGGLQGRNRRRGRYIPSHLGEVQTRRSHGTGPTSPASCRVGVVGELGRGFSEHSYGPGAGTLCAAGGLAAVGSGPRRQP